MNFSPIFEVLSIKPNNMHFEESKFKVKRKIQKLSNPYFLFCQERRPQLHSIYPQASSREVTQMLGVEWRNMREEQKAKYKDQYIHNMETRQNLVDDDPKKSILIKFPLGNNQFISIPAFVND